ncbi:MAG: homocysteine S-methyltransferase family protein [Armatimonadetes bacterium]|nr:homocysteine S-methyltransferase family protein [Armatimonadota bacterium]
MTGRFLKELADHVLVFDGATGTQFHGAGLQPSDFVLRSDPSFPTEVNAVADRLAGISLEGCNELLNFTRPDLVKEVHSRYYSVGSDIVETNTFGATSIVLAEYDIPEMDYACSLQAAKLAREVADQFSTPDKPRFVAGGLGPGTKLISLGQVSWDELTQTYRRCAQGLLEGGVDFILLETLQDLLMVKAALVAVREAMTETGIQVPIIVQVTMEQTGTMLLGTEMGAALNMLECFPEVVAVGMNCATGPVEMAPHVRFLGQHSTRPLSIQPNAGLPVMEKGQAVYKLSPEELAHHHTRFVEEHGAALVGGCCGTTPEHIRAVVAAVGGKKHSSHAHWMKVRDLFPEFDFCIESELQAEAIKLVGCSSLYQFQPYHQDTSFLIVGEKTNANGSKAFREMLSAENWEGLTELARELEGEGSHILDVCTAFVGRNEERDMRELLRRYNQHITVPIMIDSTEANVVEAGLQTLAGKPLINSINFEDGEARTEKILGLARKYGAAVVGLTIDERGMAKSVHDKLEVAERILARTRAAGLPDYDVFIDCLTFTLGSGDEEFRQSAQATIDAIRELHRLHPLVNSILGVSNVSFGLKPSARIMLNSAFLHYAREAGLTSAIVHFSKIQPENKIDPEIWKITSDLVFDRREFASV